MFTSCLLLLRPKKGEGKKAARNVLIGGCRVAVVQQKKKEQESSNRTSEHLSDFSARKQMNKKSFRV